MTKGNDADLILFNGKILTVDKNFSQAEAVAVKAGRFLIVGEKEEAFRFVGPRTERIDLTGLTVIPGIMDSHHHLEKRGLMLLPGFPWPDTVEGWLDLIAEKVAVRKPGEWICMTKPYGVEDRFVNWPGGPKALMDTVAPDHPVIMSTTPHEGIVNSCALKKMGIRKGATFEGGHFVMDENGEPTGFINAQVNMLCKRNCPIPNISVEEYKQGYREVMKESNQFGLTSVIQPSGDYNSLRALRELADEGETTVRVNTLFWQDAYDWVPIEEIETNIEKLRFVTPRGVGDEWVRIGGIKTMYDGPVAMYQFHDDRYCTPKRLRDIAEVVAKHGMRLGLHACGDRAINDYLSACRSAHQKFPIKNFRWINFHYFFPHPEDYETILELGMVVAMQPMFIHSFYSGDYVRKDPRLESLCHPIKAELERGIPVGFGSDCSTNTYDPFLGMWIAITRKSPHPGEEGWVINRGEGLSRRQALECYTIHNAYVSFEEDLKGSIEPAKLADLVVLDRDILTCKEDEIKETNVEMTIVGGKVVYRHEPSTPYPPHPYWRW